MVIPQHRRVIAGGGRADWGVWGDPAGSFSPPCPHLAFGCQLGLWMGLAGV